MSETPEKDVVMGVAEEERQIAENDKPETAEDVTLRLRAKVAALKKEKAVQPFETNITESSQSIELSQAETWARKAAEQAAGAMPKKQKDLLAEKEKIVEELQSLEQSKLRYQKLKETANPSIVKRFTDWLWRARVSSADEDHDLHITHATQRIKKLKERLTAIESEIAS